MYIYARAYRCSRADPVKKHIFWMFIIQCVLFLWVNMLCCYNRFERSYVVLGLILVFDAELPASSNWFLRSNLHYQGSWC